MLFKKFWYAWTMSVCSASDFNAKLTPADHDDLPQTAVFHNNDIAADLFDINKIKRVSGILFYQGRWHALSIIHLSYRRKPVFWFRCIPAKAGIHVPLSVIHSLCRFPFAPLNFLKDLISRIHLILNGFTFRRLLSGLKIFPTLMKRGAGNDFFKRDAAFFLVLLLRAPWSAPPDFQIYV